MGDSVFGISVHHVGGRAGSRAYPCFNWLEPAIENVLYDADPSCLEQIRQRWGGACVVLPHCVGGSRATADFHLTYDRYGSSLLTCLPEYDDCHIYSKQFSFDYDPVSHQTASVVPVTLQTLDDLFEQGGAEAGPPHFLSMDTEGSEYDILLGASRLLRTSIHGVYTEFHFLRRFTAQKSLQDLDDLLHESGFVLIDVKQSKGLYMPVCRPIGLRDQGTVGCGEALFLKIPARIVQDHPNPRLALLQAGMTALAFGHFEWCLRYLDAWVQQDGLRWLAECTVPVPDYVAVLQGIVRTVQNYPPVTPLRFTDLFKTPQRAAARFSVPRAADNEPPATPSPLGLRTEYLTRLGLSVESFRAQAELLQSERYFGVEEILNILGMTDLANTIREDRLQQIKALLQRLGF
ncbi:MAG: FkbM family methyltransferase [Magnetococcales bacterium]|nr:FkbM family methyltransferase [Magnetococcales bacterium]